MYIALAAESFLARSAGATSPFDGEALDSSGADGFLVFPDAINIRSLRDRQAFP
jgi:hypothetical protein